MTVLLDTKAVLWAGLSDPRLPGAVRDLIENRTNRRLVSAATAWEIATKVRIGKLPEARQLESDLIGFMDIAGFELLPIQAAHALRAGRFTGTHKDPWDRMIAAQALALDIPVLSSDVEFNGFGVRRIW